MTKALLGEVNEELVKRTRPLGRYCAKLAAWRSVNAIGIVSSSTWEESAAGVAGTGTMKTLM